MKIFLDTANLDELKKGVSLGIVDGVTTNQFLKDWAKVFQETPAAG